MAKKFKRTLALTMVLCMLTSVLPMQVLAADSETTTETVTDGGLTTEITTTTTTTTDEETGNVTVTIEIQQNTSGETEDGVDVTREETTTTTTTVAADGTTAEQTVTDGSESRSGMEALTPNNVTVSVPNTEGSENKNSVVYGDAAGTEFVTGDVKESENDTDYDYTTTTVVTQGTVTVTTTEITVKEVVDTENTDMTYVRNETIASEDNDLYKESATKAPEEYLAGSDNEDQIPPESVDGYDFVYVGTDNSSNIRPAVVFTEPLTDEQKLEQYGNNAYILKNSLAKHYIKWLDEEYAATIAKDENGNYVTDEDGFILDVNGNRVLKNEWTTTGPNGETYYLHRFDANGKNNYVEGWYQDGEWEKELNSANQYSAVWGGAQQFVLVDNNGNVVTTYCADITTKTEKGFGYNIENLEDATYYTEEQAKMIRSVAANGYWGTESGFGSLAAMKEQLLASGKFTEEELASLTDGVALSATQMAIWSFSNKMSGTEFINAHYIKGDVKSHGNVPEDKEDEVKLMYKIYEHLRSLSPTETENTTADTIINASNFVGDMSVTVVEKAEGHANNANKDTTDDAYITNLTFALVVTPSTENGDDLVVSIVDANGNVIASGRIAGEARDGETILTPDGDGNYCFKGITMIEGEQNFKLNLQGIQHLKEGVYLYSSEIRTTEDGFKQSSQTLVGMASGDRGVNVSLDITFNLDVDEGIIATERVWHNESDPIVTPPEQPNDGPVPMVFRLNNHNTQDNLQEIEEEPVPLASPAVTGDGSVLWIALILLSAFGIAAVNLQDKKRRNETF